MHEFERRMQQLLASHSGLTRGHRERLMRPLKQSDLECWGELEDADLEQVLKVSFRTAAHELTEAFCLHSEAALALCHSAGEKTLLSAILAYALPLGFPVLLRIGSTEAGFRFRSTEMLIVEPLASSEVAPSCVQIEHHNLAVECSSIAKVLCRVSEPGGGDQNQPQVTQSHATGPCTIVFSASRVRENPFKCAAEAFGRLFDLHSAG